MVCGKAGRPGRLELTLLVVALVLLAGWLIRRQTRTPGAVAQVSVDGEEVLRIELSAAQDGVVSLRETRGVPVDFEIRGGRIRYVNVDCPDHICERAGFIWRDGQTAVCMPNRTVLTVVGSD